MASTTLTRSLGSAGNQRLMTFSFWLKRGSLSPTAYGLFNRYISSGNYFAILLNDGDALEVRNYSGGSSELRRSTPAVFRDTSAWYHFVVTIDTAQAVTDDRVKIYVNGVQQTLTGTNPALNLDVDWNSAGDNVIGTGVTSSYFDGSMAHIHFIEGTAYNASAFGETAATTGIWKPKTAPSVTYGTNGFFLKFASAGSLGTDSSGNGNNFTLSGSGTQTQDTPSNVFATFNPLAGNTAITFSNGNTTASYAAQSSRSICQSTLGVSSGKWYWEVKVNNTYGRAGGITGYSYDTASNNVGGSLYSWGYFGDSGNVFNNGSSVGGTWATYSSSIIGIALNLDNEQGGLNKLYFSKDGVWQNGADPSNTSSTTGVVGITKPENTPSGFYFPAVSNGESTQAPVLNVNFGNGYFGTTAVSSAQSPSDGIGLFEYAVPSGFKALCTKSINAQEYS